METTIKSLQQRNLDNLTAAMKSKRINREYVATLTEQARKDIAAMREYANKRAGKVSDFCNCTADKWQAQLDAALTRSL